MSIFAGLRARLEREAVHSLHREVVRPGPTRRGRARLAAYTLAILIHATTLTLLVGGVLLVARLDLVGILLGIFALDLAWLTRPRFPQPPRDAQTLTRETAPELFHLLDEIAARVRAPQVELVIVDGAVNAAYATYGMRRRRVVHLGYPLWLVLSPQERVALLAHELAHSSNGDARQGLVVGTALGTLAELHEATRVEYRDDGEVSIVAVAFFAPITAAIRGIMLLLELLLYRATQRAEYRADAMAAEVAGAAAVASLMDATITRLTAAAHYLDTQAWAGGDQLWDELCRYVDDTPAETAEAMRQAARDEEMRVDQTHPPTHLRHEHAAALPYREPLVRAPAMEGIERELLAVAGRVRKRLLDDARDALYN